MPQNANGTTAYRYLKDSKNESNNDQSNYNPDPENKTKRKVKIIKDVMKGRASKDKFIAEPMMSRTQVRNFG